MDIRGRRTWCEDCTAPVVMTENVPIIELFLEALPAWRGGAGLMGAVAVEGFDRPAILALMDLRGLDPHERPETWAAIVDLESEYRAIRASRQARAPTH